MAEDSVELDKLLDRIIDKLDGAELECISSIIATAKTHELTSQHWEQQCAQTQMFLTAVIRNLGGDYVMKTSAIQSTPMNSVVAIYPIDDEAEPSMRFLYSSDAASVGGH